MPSGKLMTMSKRNAPMAYAPEKGSGREAGRAVPDKEKKSAVVRRASMGAWGALLIVWLVWGSTYLSIRIGDETIPPLVLAAVRYLAAGVIMFPAALRSAGRAARRRGVPGRLRPSRAQWLGCAVVGILLLGANGAVCVGERTVSSGLAALLVATVPLWLLGMDAVLNHARLGLAPVAGLVVGLAGVGLLSGLGGSRVSVSGVLIILGAAAAWALGTIMAGRVATPASPALTSAMELLTGGAALLVLAAATGELGSFRASAVSGRSWLALGYLIVFGSIVAFSAYVVAVRLLPTATVATYAYVNPVIAVLLGTLILNEPLTPATLAGGALIVGAVVLVVRGRALDPRALFSRTSHRGSLLDAAPGQGVRALIARIARVTLHPQPADLVDLHRLDQPAPQVRVLDRLPGRRHPAVALPAGDPFGDPVQQVLAVGVQRDPGRAPQRLKRPDGRHQLHPVVRGQRLAAMQFPLRILPAEHRAPAPRARVPAARAVRVDHHLGHAGRLRPAGPRLDDLLWPPEVHTVRASPRGGAVR
jgi:drug/metabolite transporter (DMT)-like permease